MEEPGVSKIVTVRMTDEVKAEAPPAAPEAGPTAASA
jgi:hypothetical protein